MAFLNELAGLPSRARNNGMALTTRLAHAGRTFRRGRRVPLPGAFRASYSLGSPLN